MVYKVTLSLLWKARAQEQALRLCAQEIGVGDSTLFQVIKALQLYLLSSAHMKLWQSTE
jgi:hypothetical protein